MHPGCMPIWWCRTEQQQQQQKCSPADLSKTASNNDDNDTKKRGKMCKKKWNETASDPSLRAQKCSASVFCFDIWCMAFLHGIIQWRPTGNTAERCFLECQTNTFGTSYFLCTLFPFFGWNKICCRCTVHLYDDDGGFLFVLRILAYMGYSYHSYLVPHKNIHNGLYTLILNHVTSMRKLEIEWNSLSDTS